MDKVLKLKEEPGEFATKGEGNKQSYPPSNYIKPTHFVHFWNS